MMRNRQMRLYEEAQERQGILEHRRKNSRDAHRLPPQFRGLRRERRSPPDDQAEAQRIANFLDDHCTPLFPREYHHYFYNHTYVCTLDNPNSVTLPLTAEQFKSRISSFSQPPVPLEEGLHRLNGWIPLQIPTEEGLGGRRTNGLPREEAGPVEQ